MKKFISAIAVLAMLLCLCACTQTSKDGATTTPTTEEVITCQHNYQKTVSTEAGCTAEGVMDLKCVYCGTESTEPIPANGHSFSNATCTTPATCSTCGATEGEALAHDYFEDVCLNCGASISQKKAITEGVWSYTDMSEGMKQYTLKAKTLSLALEDNTGDQAAVTYNVSGDTVTVTVTGEDFTVTLERVSDTSFKVTGTTGEGNVLPPVDAIFVYASK